MRVLEGHSRVRFTKQPSRLWDQLLPWVDFTQLLLCSEVCQSPDVLESPFLLCSVILSKDEPLNFLCCHPNLQCLQLVSIITLCCCHPLYSLQLVWIFLDVCPGPGTGLPVRPCLQQTLQMPHE